MLEEKPDKSTATIESLKDLRAVLNKADVMNNLGLGLSILAADEYNLTSSQYANLPVMVRNAYIWDPQTNFSEWEVGYNKIYYANNVLQELERIQDGTIAERNNIKGQALFFRAFAFFELSQLYCKPFSVTADSDLGLPLRLTPNLEEKIFRSSLDQTYERILTDLMEAENLLPMRNGTINHPGKLACYAMLARVYLSINDFSNAEKYANLYLAESPGLMDFNALDSVANPSISRTNIENVFFAYYEGYIPGPSTIVNPELISLYHDRDLRRPVLFINGVAGSTFKGSYYGEYGYYGFRGLATNEIYLIRAECRARLEDVSGAMDDINALLIKRWEAGFFSPFTAESKAEALTIILQERKKELVFRGTRWTDLRRLNLEGANIALSRTVDGATYSLSPNDNRWVWLIPVETVKLSGIVQNER